MNDSGDLKDGIVIEQNIGLTFANYSSMSYLLQDALAELIDNSFDSYNKNKKALEEAGSEFCVSITINNQKKSVEVRDSAYGMSHEELKNALIPDRRNPDHGHIGLYGRGMKTACGWFGKKWTITSKKLGEEYESTAVVDIAELISSASNFIPVTTKKVASKYKMKSYTKILVEQGERSYHARTQSAAKAALSVKYQRFLGKSIDIEWIGSSSKEIIQFEEPEIYHAKNEHYDSEEAERDENYNEPEEIIYEFPCQFEIKDQETGEIKGKLTGRYGIYPPQRNQTRHAGLTIFWRDRVIVDRSKDYWPEKVFGNAAGDLRRQRVFVKLETDMDPTSDKIDFKWDKFSFDELEKALELLHGGNLVEISALALAIRKKGSKDLTPEQIKAELVRLKKLIGSIATRDAMLKAHPILQTGLTNLTEDQEEALDAEDAPSVNIEIAQGQPELVVKTSEIMHQSDDFCKIKLKTDELKIKLYINSKHPFYQRYCTESSEAHSLYVKLISALALARWSANTTQDEVNPESYLTLVDSQLKAQSNPSS